MLNVVARRLLALWGWRRLLVAFLAGLLAALAMRPLLLWPALVVALTTFIWLMDSVAADPAGRMRRAVSALALGWSFGFGYFIASLYWIGAAFLVDADVYAWMMPIAVTALPAGMALYWGGAAFVAALLWRPGIGRIFFFAALLALAEWLRGHMFTGFPWNALGYAAEPVWGIEQIAAFVGLWGLTFLVVLWSSIPARLADDGLAPSSYVFVGFVLLSAIAVAGWGAARLSGATSRNVEGVFVRIVQPNIPQNDKWRYDNAVRIFETLVRLSGTAPSGQADAPPPSIVVWPESSVPVLIDEETQALGALADRLPSGATLLMGSLRRSPQGERNADVFNSLLAISGGRVLATYDKWHLVPYGEYLPLESWLAPLGLRRVVTVPGSFASGPSPMTLAPPGVPPFSPLICYEVIFPGSVTRNGDRPRWLLNVTNDGWFGDTSGPHQHLGQARMRAIEEGLPLLRAANTGISAVIDPYGRILASLPLGHEGSLDTNLPEALPPTIYSRLKDIPFFAMLAFAFLFALAVARRPVASR